MHTHGAVDPGFPLWLYVANGVTSIRDTGGPVTALRLTRQNIQSGKKLGPRLFYAGTILDGSPPLFPAASTVVDTPREAEAAVEFLIEQGADFIKVYNGITEPVLAAIIRTAHRRGIPVTGHVPRTLTMTKVVQMGMDGLEHIRVTGRELLPPDEANKLDFLPYAQRETLLWQKFDLASPRMKVLVALLAEKQVVLDATLTEDKRTLTTLRSEVLADPNNRFLPRALFEQWSRIPLPDFWLVPPELKKVAAASYAERKQFVMMCARAGVPIVAGTDGAGPGLQMPGFGLQGELRLLAEAGLSSVQALQAATINAARALKRERQIGSIEAGKAADLVVLDSDPFVDIRSTANISAVVLSGQLLDRNHLDTLLRDPDAASKN
jgi:imidazolonepropionase-like amidohydrolase